MKKHVIASQILLFQNKTSNCYWLFLISFLYMHLVNAYFLVLIKLFPKLVCLTDFSINSQYFRNRNLKV